MMKHILSVACSLMTLPACSQVTLECDYSNASNQRKPMHDHWDISNRITPLGGFNPVLDNKGSINIVRPLGGKPKREMKGATAAYETYKWDGKKYYYDWAPLKKQIDTVTSKMTLHQLNIDNPPFAFQRGLKNTEEETYGNAWPPNDAKAWAEYIRAMARELVKTYGRAQAEKWRYCIGREVGTPGHWRGTQQQFHDHYRNTEHALRSVLPNAVIGTHFMSASSKHSFGPRFVKWCKANGVRYDFIGISYYPMYNRKDRVDMDHVYKVDIAPIIDIPEWNPDATLEFHEFRLITYIKKNVTKGAPKQHQNAFTVMMAKMMYENDLYDVYRWGNGADTAAAERSFSDWKGDHYYTSARLGTPRQAGHMIDAVFSRDIPNHQYNVIAYNYNPNPGATDTEAIEFKMTLPVPSGTAIKYRMAAYQKSNHRAPWSEWNTGRTRNGSSDGNSLVSLTAKLPSFSFVKYEIIADGEP